MKLSQHNLTSIADVEERVRVVTVAWGAAVWFGASISVVVAILFKVNTYIIYVLHFVSESSAVTSSSQKTRNLKIMLYKVSLVWHITFWQLWESGWIRFSLFSCRSLCGGSV